MKLENASIGALAALISLIAPANAASVFFTPNGSQSDSDTPNEVLVLPSSTLDVSFQLDTSGLSSNLQSLTFTGVRDETTLAIDNLTQPSESLAALGQVNISRDQTNPTAVTFTVAFPGTTGTGVAPNTILDLLNVTYNVGSITNDGSIRSDLALLDVTSAITTDGTDVTSLFTTSGNIDVEPVPEPSSILGLLTLGGLGVILAKKRNKKQLANSKCE